MKKKTSKKPAKSGVVKQSLSEALLFVAMYLADEGMQAAAGVVMHAAEALKDSGYYLAVKTEDVEEFNRILQGVREGLDQLENQSDTSLHLEGDNETE